MVGEIEPFRIVESFIGDLYFKFPVHIGPNIHTKVWSRTFGCTPLYIYNAGRVLNNQS